LLNTVATKHCDYFKVKFIKIKYNKKFSSSVTLAIFQVLISHMLLVVMILNIKI
jgi:hypothetical protein